MRPIDAVVPEPVAQHESGRVQPSAVGVVRAGGVVSRAGAPQYSEAPADFGVFRNITLTGGVAPARAYIEELLPGRVTNPEPVTPAVRGDAHHGPTVNAPIRFARLRAPSAGEAQAHRALPGPIVS
jgi:hypothetical protein